MGHEWPTHGLIPTRVGLPALLRDAGHAGACEDFGAEDGDELPVREQLVVPMQVLDLPEQLLGEGGREAESLEGDGTLDVFGGQGDDLDAHRWMPRMSRIRWRSSSE